jgi:DNA processing protein
MIISLSDDTQAVLLLTASLIAGGADASSELLTAGEYQRVARLLNQMDRQPADLLNPQRGEFSNEWKTIIDVDRFQHLLGREASTSVTLCNETN